jgi:hypothetical protein
MLLAKPATTVTVSSARLRWAGAGGGDDHGEGGLIQAGGCGGADADLHRVQLPRLLDVGQRDQQPSAGGRPGGHQRPAAAPVQPPADRDDEHRPGEHARGERARHHGRTDRQVGDRGEEHGAKA